MRKKALIWEKKKQAKAKDRLAVPQNIRTKCPEQSACGVWFSCSVKKRKKFESKDFFMFTHILLRCMCYFSPVIFD